MSVRIFISYSRADEATANLLWYILENAGIQCDIDRKLPTAHPFDARLKKMIMDADIILVLLTRSSLSSAWVNQEVGFAVAHNKQIWPLAMEHDLAPIGMIKTFTQYSFFDWSQASFTINNLVDQFQRMRVDNHARFGDADSRMETIFTRRTDRTRFLARTMREMRQGKCPEEKVIIYNQAAFSIFGYSREVFSEAEVGKEYLDALMDELAAFRELLECSRVHLRLLIQPLVRKSGRNAENLELSYRNLLTWLESVIGNERIQVRCGEFQLLNRFIVKDRFVLEGYKNSFLHGYDMSIVRRNPEIVQTAAEEFEAYWKAAEGDNHHTYEKVREMSRQAGA